MREILAWKETHDWVIDFLSKEKESSIWDIPAGIGALSVRLLDIGFIDLSYFEIGFGTLEV